MKFWQLFLDSEGRFSLTIFGYALWSIVLLGLVTYLTIKKGAFPDVSVSVLILYGSVITGKFATAFAENVAAKLSLNNK